MAIDFASYSPNKVPESTMPNGGLPSALVEAMISKDMEKDTPPNQDFGRFSTTKFDEAMIRILSEAALRNSACVEEYPSIAKFQARCISILTELWGSSPNDNPFGTSTTGSSEAVILGGLAMKRKWQIKYTEDSYRRPNVIIGENAHICIKKFADYFDVEARYVPVSSKTKYCLSPEDVQKRIDGNTIGVFATLGTTYTGHYDPVEEISKMLDNYEHETGNDIPIHVDAASGGFIAPFTATNDAFVWDFRLPRVKSINTSGHKYGQAVLAVGWIVWREKEWIPHDLLLESSYLRGAQTAYTLSFSRSSIPVATQYYQLYHQGLTGYRDRVNQYLDISRLLSLQLEKSGFFVCLSDVHRPWKIQIPPRSTLCRESGPTMHPGIPSVVFTLSDDAKKRYPKLDLSSLSDSLHDMKLSIPHYTINGWGENNSDIDVMRIVVREEMTRPLMQQTVGNIMTCLKSLIDG